MSKRDPLSLVEDMVESAFKIVEYTVNLSYGEFIKDRKTIDAVIRNFKIIGEAANRLPDNFKDQHTTIDWQRIRGFRNWHQIRKLVQP